MIKKISAILLSVSLVSGMSIVASAQKISAKETAPAAIEEMGNPLVVIGDFKTDYKTFKHYQSMLEQVRIIKGEEAVKLYGKDAVDGVILAQPKMGNRFVDYKTLAAGNNAIKNAAHEGISLNGTIVPEDKFLIKREELRGIEVITLNDANGTPKKYLNFKTVN